MAGNSERVLDKCLAHGMHFDPTLHSGCVVCRRENPRASQPAPPLSASEGNLVAFSASQGRAPKPSSAPPPSAARFAAAPSAPPRVAPYSSASAFAPQFQPPAHYGPGSSRRACAVCGNLGADYFPKYSAPKHRLCAGLGPDELHWAWLLLVYPFTMALGWSFIAAGLVSIPYYIWRKDYPLRAKTYNRHVWIAFGSSCLFLLLIVIAGLIVGDGKRKAGALVANPAPVASLDAPHEDTAPAPLSPSALVAYSTSDGLVTVRVPSSWKPADHKAEIKLKLESPEGASLVILSESRVNFETSVGVADYLALVKRSLLANLQSRHMSASYGADEAARVAALPGLRSPVHSTIDGMKAEGYVCATRSANSFHQFLYLYLPSRAATDGPILEAIVASAEIH